MAFTLFHAQGHFNPNDSAIGEYDPIGNNAQEVLISIYEAMRGNGSRPYTQTGWLLDFHGTGPSGTISQGTERADMGGVLFGTGWWNASYFQGYIHTETGAKLAIIYTVGSSWPFDEEMVDDPWPKGLSIVYIPPEKANDVSWPDPSDYSGWGASLELKCLSLASGVDFSSLIMQKNPYIVYNYYILCDNDTIGIIEHLYLGNGVGNDKVADYWPEQRSVGLFAGKIFKQLAHSNDTSNYGMFLLQPEELRSETTIPNGYGFWQHYKPEQKIYNYQQGCPFYYWLNDVLVLDSTMYSYDSNTIMAMSTSGERFVPLAVGQKKDNPTSNDLKGYLDTDLFRMVKHDIPSGTLLGNNTYNVIGGGLAISWKSSNANFLLTGRPVSYNNNIGLAEVTGIINAEVKGNLSLVEEYNS